MRILSTSWLLLTGAVSAATTSAKIYLLEPHTPSTESLHHDTVRSETAKLILSRRLGFSDFYSLSGSDENSIQQIDTLGGPQQHPFSAHQHSQESRVLLVVEGISSVEDIVSLLPIADVTRLQSFEVNPAPQSSDTKQLLDEFIAEAERYSPLHQEAIRSSKSLENIESLQKLASWNGNRFVARDARLIIHITSLMVSFKATLSSCAFF